MSTENFDKILASWPAEQKDLSEAFMDLTLEARMLPNIKWELLVRKGVSYSFRVSTNDNSKKRQRPVFCLMDVVMSKFEPWFLSVCFYEDEITDPSGLGNCIPSGLFEETGYCFDLEENDISVVSYLKDRLAEAHRVALGKKH